MSALAILLRPAIQEFIQKNITKNIADIAFQKNPFENEIEWRDILNQIQSKQKAKNKLPSWYQHDNIIFPSSLSIEQTSSEITAQFKSQLISGQSLIDLTGGFGVDDYYFAKRFESVIHCEMNTTLSEIVAHNSTVMGVQNITTYEGDSLHTLQQLNRQFDWIYLDPARRDDSQNKVFLLEDCTPDVVNHLAAYYTYATNIMMKTSPLLDFHNGIKALNGVKTIHIVAVKNEVKELLWILEKDYIGTINILAHNINGEQVDTFEHELIDDDSTAYGAPTLYLYEPNAAIMKSGAFNAVANHFHVQKLAPFSHLYTSENQVDFPGRVFTIKQVIVYQKSNFAALKQFKQANITTRNFPETVAELRQKFKLKDGGTTYLFFTTLANDEKVCIVCEK